MIENPSHISIQKCLGFMIAHTQRYPEYLSDIGMEWVFSGLLLAALSLEALQPLPIHKPLQYKCYTKPGLLVFLAV